MTNTVCHKSETLLGRRAALHRLFAHVVHEDVKVLGCELRLGLLGLLLVGELDESVPSRISKINIQCNPEMSLLFRGVTIVV